MLGVDSPTHSKQTASLLSSLDEIIGDQEPDVVLVYGDTNATLAGALVGAKRNALVAHAEAGLRSYDRYRPEEIKCAFTDHCAELLFVPSDRTEHFLADEGITDGVYNTGDIIYDSLLTVRNQAWLRSDILSTCESSADEYVLVALQRTSNINDSDQLNSIMEGHATVPWPVVLPSNPRLDDALERHG